MGRRVNEMHAFYYATGWLKMNGKQFTKVTWVDPACNWLSQAWAPHLPFWRLGARWTLGRGGVSLSDRNWCPVDPAHLRGGRRGQAVFPTAFPSAWGVGWSFSRTLLMVGRTLWQMGSSHGAWRGPCLQSRGSLLENLKRKDWWEAVNAKDH